jgi:hypothetical protein
MGNWGVGVWLWQRQRFSLPHSVHISFRTHQPPFNLLYLYFSYHFSKHR